MHQINNPLPLNSTFVSKVVKQVGIRNFYRHNTIFINQHIFLHFYIPKTIFHKKRISFCKLLLQKSLTKHKHPPILIIHSDLLSIFLYAQEITENSLCNFSIYSPSYPGTMQRGKSFSLSVM